MQTPDSAADIRSWEAYEKFLKGLPRPERRRVLKAHSKRIKYATQKNGGKRANS